MSSRTLPQNNALHLWCRRIAQALNDAGYTVNSRDVLRLDVPFTELAVKEYMFKKIMSTMYPDKTSTAQLSKIELSEIAEVLNQHLGEKLGIHVPFPHEEQD